MKASELGAIMEQEIRQQPKLLAENQSTYFEAASHALGGRKFDLVLLAARGSSDNAALYARYLIETKLGIPVSLAAPSVITRYKSAIQYPNCLAIGISQSGSAPDVSEVLAYMRAQGHTTLAITNTPESRLTQEAEFSLLLNAGIEKSVAATKTFTTSLLALHEMVRALAPSKLPTPQLPDDAWVQQMLDFAEATSGLIIRCNPVFALARGYGFATALETALKLMECALIPCKAYSAADFEHGPKALAGHGSVAISFSGPMTGLENQGCEIVEVPAPLGDEAELEPVFPIWDVIYGQWASLLAARARGLNPDQARHLSKVTETL